MKYLLTITAATLSLLLTNCSPLGPRTLQPNPELKTIKQAGFVNPHPPGTYAHFKAGSYPGTTRTYKNSALLARANPSNTHIKIDLSSQRGFLMIGDQVAMDYRISSGRSSHKTPTGSYRITEKIKDKRSNLYGKIYNASGALVKSNADTRKDKVPPGGKYVGSPMLYWMRLTNDGIGMHKGNVNRRYASHGCIRSHYSAIPIVYAKTRIGTPVTIEN